MLGNLLDEYIEGTLTKMAEKMWQKDKRVRHNEKHKEKSPYRKDRN